MEYLAAEVLEQLKMGLKPNRGVSACKGSLGLVGLGSVQRDTYRLGT